MGPNKMSGLDLLVVVVVFYYIAEVLLVSKLWLFGKKYHTAVLRTFSMTSSMLRTDFVFFMAKVLQIALFFWSQKRNREKSFFTDPTS